MQQKTEDCYGKSSIEALCFEQSAAHSSLLVKKSGLSLYFIEVDT